MKAKSLILALPVDYSTVIENVNRKVPAWISKSIFEQALRLMGPFYRELGVKILVWSRVQCELGFELRKRRLRFDESLNGGAIGGLGQVTSALLLLRNLDTRSYKFQLKELNVVVKDSEFVNGVTRTVKDEQIWRRDIQALETKGRSTFRIQVDLVGKREEVFATVRSHWLVETR